MFDEKNSIILIHEQKAVKKILTYTRFFCKKLRQSLSTQSFLAFCDFEYSKFLNSFLTFFSEI